MMKTLHAAQRTEATDVPVRNSAQSRLLRGYLHKTSNSLCGIKGYASLIVEDRKESSETVRWARKIIAEVERMEDIFHSVGDLTGKRHLPDLESNVATVVEEVSRQCSTAFDNLEISIGEIPAGEILLPAADLALVLQEIIKNSSQSKDSGTDPVLVVISGHVSAEGKIILSVGDNGPGIATNLINQVTDPFLTTRSGFMGMGLARVETIMEMHELPWKLESKPGQGTWVQLEAAAKMELVAEAN